MQYERCKQQSDQQDRLVPSADTHLESEYDRVKIPDQFVTASCRKALTAASDQRIAAASRRDIVFVTCLVITASEGEKEC